MSPEERPHLHPANAGMLPHILLAVLVGLFSLAIGQVQFAGYDSSALIDAGWRLMQHQHPYTDFYCLLPPSFALLAAGAFRLFGIHWWSLNLAETIVYWLLCGIGLHLSYTAQRRKRATPSDTRLLTAYIVALSLPTLVTSHLWHSTFASQLSTALLFTLLYLWRTFGAASVWDRAGLIYAALLTAGILLSKPNIAVVCLGCSILFPALSRRRSTWFAWLGILASAAILALGVLRLANLSPVDILHSYAQISDRPNPFAMLIGGPLDWEMPSSLHSTAAAYGIFCILAVATGVALATRSYVRSDPSLAVLAGGISIAICGFATNWDLKFNDLGPALFGMAAFLLAPPSSSVDAASRLRRRNLLSRAAIPIAACALILGFALSVTRARMETEGEWAMANDGPLRLGHDPFFGTFLGSTAFWAALRQADSVCADAPAHSRIFFGPRLEFLYARRRLPSPTGLPIWLHAGSSYPAADESQMVRRWIDSRFDLLFFVFEPNRAYIRVPPAFLQEIAAHYVLISPPGAPLDVYRRRP